MATKKQKAKRKKGGGRKSHSGVKSSIDAQRDSLPDIHKKLYHGHREWRIVRLRELIGDGSKLAGNHLRAAVLPDEKAWLWQGLSAEFEHAVLDGDAEWFERQANAVRRKDNRTDKQKDRDRFYAAVIRELGMASAWTQSKQRAEQEKNEQRWKEAQKNKQFEWEQYRNSPEGRAANQQQRQAKWAALGQGQTAKPHVESATLEPAGKYADVTARQIYDSLPKEECPTEFPDGRERQPHGIRVEGCYFENRERCCEAIRELAKLLGMKLRREQGKWPKTKPSKRLSTDYYHGLSRKARRTAIEKLRRIVSTD